MKNHLIRWAVLPLLLFALLAVCVQAGATSGVEAAVYRVVAAWITPALTAAMRMVTRLFDPPVVAAICLLLLAIPATRRNIAPPVVAAAVLGAGGNWVLKHLFLRERPNLLPLVEETSPSFPSGHSMTSAAICTAFLLLLLQQVPRRRWRRLLAVPCILLPLLVGASRIYLGVHYAGDVLGGWLLGTASGMAALALWQWVRAKYIKNNPGLQE